MTSSAVDQTVGGQDLAQFRRRSWTAIGVGTVLSFIATIAYATAFVDEDGRADRASHRLGGLARSEQRTRENDPGTRAGRLQASAERFCLRAPFGCERAERIRLPRGGFGVPAEVDAHRGRA